MFCPADSGAGDCSAEQRPLPAQILAPKHGLLGAAFAVIITSTVLGAGEVVLLWYVLSNVNRLAEADRLLRLLPPKIPASEAEELAVKDVLNHGRKSA